jgi:hypothetical protein
MHVFSQKKFIIQISCVDLTVNTFQIFLKSKNKKNYLKNKPQKKKKKKKKKKKHLSNIAREGGLLRRLRKHCSRIESFTLLT